jgi:AAA domain
MTDGPWQEFRDQLLRDEPSDQEATRHFVVQRIGALPSHPPPVVIQGLLYQGGKLLISAPSKSRKSFLIFELLYCCANGFNWWGKSVPSGEVLLLNFELMPWEVRARFEMIQASYEMGNFDRIDVINLRGLQFKYHELSVIAKDAGSKKYVLTGLDPAYKLLAGLRENDSGDITKLLAAIEAFATELDAAAVINHHFAKGDASAKEAIDRASGSGVWARDPDGLISLTPHQLEDHYTVVVDVRSFAKPADFVIRWQHPRFYADSDADPDELKISRGGRPRVTSLEKFVACIARDEEISYGDLIRRSALILGVSERTAKRYLTKALCRKLIFQSALNGLYATWPTNDKQTKSA